MGTGALTGTCLPPAGRSGNVGRPGRILSLSISASGRCPDTSHFCSTELSPGGAISPVPWPSVLVLCEHCWAHRGTQAAGRSKPGLCGCLLWLGSFNFPAMFNGVSGGFVMQSELRKALCLVNVVSGVAPCWSCPPQGRGSVGQQQGQSPQPFPAPGKKAGL